MVQPCKPTSFASPNDYLHYETVVISMIHDVHAAIAALANGDMVVVLDDAGRENEADLMMAAQHADTQSLAFFVDHTSGYVCAPMTGPRAEASTSL